MNQKANNLLSELNEQLNFINLEIDNRIERCEKSIELILFAVQKLKIIFNSDKLKSEEREIDFFKNVKPKFTSKLIYYNIIYKIEAQMPYGGERILKKYLNNELEKIKRYFYNNHDFNKYHRTGATYLDNKYYVRGKIDIKLAVDSFFFEADHTFSTSHDFKLAKILAHDLVQVYIEDRLRDIDYKVQKEKSQREPNITLTWTASKVALIELIYALQTEGVFNNGVADVKDIIHQFEKSFDIDLGQYRRTFLEIRGRKTDRPKFLLTLKDTLEKRMNNSDERI